MQCRKCSGRGKEWYDEENYGPCTECHGFGTVHCCEGEIVATPDYEPLLKSKAKIETYTIVKDPPNTGYEMTYYNVTNPLVEIIKNIILEGVR